ncbi:hypothetical protein [Streptomyces niveus]
MAAFDALPHSDALLVIVFEDRDALKAFLWRRHLKDLMWIPGEKAERALSVAPAAPPFTLGGATTQEPEPKQEDGFMARASREDKRYKMAVDSGYYCVIYYADSQARTDSIDRLGLAGITNLGSGPEIILSGAEVEQTLAG